MTPVTHADTLRGMAKAFQMVGSYERVDTCLAGAEALDALDRVRELLTSLRRSQQFARRRWDANCETWDGAASDTLHYIIYDLTNALEGETNE